MSTTNLVEQLLDDNAKYVTTRQGNRKKKYNNEKVWLYETAWFNKDDPRLNQEDVIIYGNPDKEQVVARVRTRLAVQSTRILQTSPSGETVNMEPALYDSVKKPARRCTNITGLERSYNRNRNWQ